MMTGPIEIRSERRASSSGFTIIELVTVVSVIAVLIALLLPSVQSAREQARRLQCTNNLLQIGLAIHNYASAHRVFPPGVVDWKGPVSNLPGGYQVGWTLQILPYMEMRNAWNQFNFRFGVHDLANSTTQFHSLNSYSCPSDGRGWAGANGNYTGCHHDAEAPIDVDNHGVLFLNSKINLDDIADGPACTILVGEYRRGSASSGWSRGGRATLRNTGHRINSTEATYTPPSFEMKPRRREDDPDLVEEPNWEEKLSSYSDLTLWFVGGFSSYHPGGANFLFCDGSVRPIKQKIAPELFRALGNRADGQLISDDQF